MKRCSYCGKEYAEEITNCQLDRHPVAVEIKRQTGLAVQPAATQDTFDLILISPISRAGTYGVFIERSDMIFIQIGGGSKSILTAMAPLFGLAGGLVPLALWMFTKKKARDQIQNLEPQRLEDLLREDHNNFRLYLAEIREAAIEPATWLTTRGKAGRLIFTVRHGDEMKFEFESAGEIANAIQLVAPLLNSSLRVNVEWNGDKHQYQGKKTG